MRLIALNGHAAPEAPWRGALVLGPDDGPGVLLDPTGALAARLEADAALRSRAGLDHGARAVVLTAARLDQVAALIGLRHGAPIDLYTTPAIFEDLTSALPVLPEVQRACEVHWRMVPVAGDQDSAAFHVAGRDALRFTAVASRGDAGLRGRVLAGAPVALALDDAGSGGRAVWLRGRHRFGFGLGALLEGADLLVVSQDGDTTDLALVDWLAAQPAARKWLLGGAPDRDGSLARLGIEQPHDGLEAAL